MFDYYVDESGEWDPWQSRYDYLPGAIHEGKGMGLQQEILFHYSVAKT